MISMPDFVDYRTHTIAEFKSIFMRQPPHEDGVLMTTAGPVMGVHAQPGGAEPAAMDLWDQFRDSVQRRVLGVYEAQVGRYARAYFEATQIVPKFILCIAAFGKTAEREPEPRSRGRPGQGAM